MDRRDFVRSAGTAGLLAAVGPAWIARAKAAEPRSPMGRPLGADETLLVHNAKLVDVIGGGLFRETEILIRGGKIEKLLSKKSDAKIEADRKIDAGGRYIIPGLINAHVHITLPGVAGLSFTMIKSYGEQIERNCVDCITHGVTTVRDQMGDQEQIMSLKDSIAGGELMGPRILRSIGVEVAGGYLDYGGATRLLNDAVKLAENVSEARDAVAFALDQGVDHIKLGLQAYSLLGSGNKPLKMMPDDMMRAVVEKAESLGVPTAVHHTCRKGFQKAMRAGVHSFEHMTRDRSLEDSDIELFKASGRAIVPTGSVAWALTYPRTSDENFDHPMVQKIYKDKMERMDSVLEEYTVPGMARLGKKIHRKYSRPGYFDRDRMMIVPSVGFFIAAGAIGGPNMMRMYEAGCIMGCGNDGGIPFTWPGSLPLEMLLNQEAGMKPEDVLRSATAVNAEIIRMDDSLGTLDAGKIADMVLLDGNPLENMENVGKVEAVLQSGRLVYTKGGVKET